jgi:hypothetical protein
LPFLGPIFRIVVHADALISSTGIDKIKHSFIIFIYNIFLIFNLPASNGLVRQMSPACDEKRKVIIGNDLQRDVVRI